MKHGEGKRFWSIVTLLFLVSSIGLTTFFTSTFSTQSRSLAYTPGSTNILDMGHYMQTFGFYNPTATYSIPSSDFERLKAMVPYASKAVDAFNASHGTSVEPELIVWWSYAEGVNGRVTFSNCNDSVYSITNCYYPASWQLGYGMQFSAISILQQAFSDTEGDPNNAALVQQVGQNVLNIDKQSGASGCGGYSCTFPKMTVAQIMSGVSTSHETTNNWWASVLSRDPAINAYINAEALQMSWFNRQKAFGWGSYYQNNWQIYSNKLATILRNWIALGGCAAGSNCYVGEPSPKASGLSYVISKTFSIILPKVPTSVPTSIPTSTPTPTLIPTAIPTVVPSPTMTFGVIIAPTSSPTLLPTPTPKPTEIPTPTIEATPVATQSPWAFFFASNITPTAMPTLTPNSTPSDIPLPTAASPAPIQSIFVQVPTPAPVQLVAGASFYPFVGIVSSFGLLLSLLLSIPSTRRKIFAISHFFRNKKSLGKQIAGIFDVRILENGNNVTRVTLTDESGIKQGFFKGNMQRNGFAKITGVEKNNEVEIMTFDLIDENKANMQEINTSQ